jgi:hypothetical protein
VAPFLDAAITPCPASYCVLQNDYLRFGSGAESSINQYGMMRQPFYKSGGVFYKLTYDIQPLGMAVGTGTTSSHWSKAFVVDINGLTPSLTVDYSGFVITSGNIGYGTIVSENTVTINGQSMQIRNTVTLGQNSHIFETITTITNLAATPMTNVLLWVGIPDNFFASSDSTMLTRGNVAGGQFTVIATTDEPSSAVKISRSMTTDVVYFYSYDSCGRSVIGNSYGFDKAYNLNPAGGDIQLASEADRAFAVLSNLGTLDAGGSSTYSYYLQTNNFATFATEPGPLVPCTNYITDSPTPSPTNQPTRQPSESPIIQPSAPPTAEPTEQPSGEPTGQPSSQPSAEPSGEPSAQPTGEPSSQPTSRSTIQPSKQPTEHPSSKPTLQPTIGLLGPWCVKIGLFDSFGDGWGRGAALRIYLESDPGIFIDITNENRAFVDTTLCLNPSMLLYAEVICTECDLKEYWEIIYSMTEVYENDDRGKPRYGGYNTVMRLRNRAVTIVRNARQLHDRSRKCDDKCSRDHDFRYGDKVIDMTGEGKSNLVVIKLT